MKPNLLVLGASGGVANAFLHYLVNHREVFDKLILLDKNKKLLSDPYIDHKGLKYKFIHKKIVLPEKEKEYFDILRKYKINIALDLTDMDSIPIIEATNKAGINYINTAMNAEKKTVSELIFEVISKKNKLKNAVHILCTGMNPGIVNMWVKYGIEKFGKPKEIVHFEYDTSMFATKFKPMVTWSIHEFLVESVTDPSGIMLGRNKLKPLFPNAIKHRVNMKPILKPILRLDKYPYGSTVLHEENLTIAQKYNIPSKFIYAVNMKTMDNLLRVYKKKGSVSKKEFILGDNTTKILEGSDNIGVILDYSDKKVYYFNSIPNTAILGTNATYTQVAVGVFAALFALMFDKLKNGTYFVEDLFNSHFKYYMFDNMKVQEFIFKGNRLVKYNPEIKEKRRNHFEHLYI